MSTDIGNLLGRLGNQDAAGCPAPFIGEALHPFRGGFYGGRNCAENPLAPPGNASRCCIPCPVYDYTYQADFKRLTDGAAWVNVAGFILCSFLLLSNAVLPSAITRRSYLNIVILVGILILELGFIVPLARQPEQCFDPVTPNGQGSDLTCAFSGAFLAFGLLFYVVWILIRSLFMHVQVCWNRTPDKIAYIAANVAAFSITISLTTATLAHTGVSYRFGGYCHINAFDNVDKLIPWLLCIIETQEKEQCLNLTSPFIISENIAVATLFILSFVGIEAFFLLCRWEIFGAWWSLIRRPRWKRNNSSVSNFMVHQAQQREQKTPVVEEKTPREQETAVNDTNAARPGRDDTAAAGV
ncbi:uncharacterized protein RHO25_004900 [Cercospora beticola]|uniref:G-protein coupled receptors family 2 profile 2 domain-containing protein n=1 Tax=Cercospora beticola TaxID=122368 RepID=A0ABZ0NL98_CERBT|nr:hypothetical protein RHO25_004900 [Cercospora beticola]